VELTPVEFRLLQTMIAQPGRVFSRENLMRASYPDRRVVSDRTVDSHVKNLRKKVNAVVGDEDLIHSIYGVGYKLE
jgi:two-component system response regulator BaeR